MGREGTGSEEETEEGNEKMKRQTSEKKWKGKYKKIMVKEILMQE
jgi:hypothetical protein